MYPLTFNDLFKSVIWGGDKIGRFKGIKLTQESVGESWEISDVKGNVSVVKNGADAGLSLDDLIRRDGAIFPYKYTPTIHWLKNAITPVEKRRCGMS